MATTEELRAIAAQLAHPDGDTGRSIARMMDETNIGMTTHAFQSLNMLAEQAILEVGHGNAGHLAALFEQHPQIHYTGLERSSCMHKEAITTNESVIREGNARFFLYDGNEMPFVDQKFDAIFSVNTVYFWDNAPDFLGKLGALLKEDGKIAISFADKAFMETLPFTNFGFKLYAEPDMLTLADPTQLRHLETLPMVENVTNKLGETVERKFFTIIWQKI